MTVEQKDRITTLRNNGKSYAEIAREPGSRTASIFPKKQGEL